MQLISADALRDLNMLPESEKKIESSTNGGFYKPQTEHKNVNLEEQRKNSCPLVEICPNENGTVVSGTEAASAEVEYIESENLDDIEDVDTSLEFLIGSLESKDWVVVSGALNNVRRFSVSQGIVVRQAVSLNLFMRQAVTKAQKRLKTCHNCCGGWSSYLPNVLRFHPVC